MQSSPAGVHVQHVRWADKNGSSGFEYSKQLPRERELVFDVFYDLESASDVDGRVVIGEASIGRNRQALYRGVSEVLRENVAGRDNRGWCKAELGLDVLTQQL